MSDSATQPLSTAHGPPGATQADVKPYVSSDPLSPRRRNPEEIAANRARAVAKVSPQIAWL